MGGLALLITFFVAIAVMIVMISRWRIHPFLAILLIALIYGLLGGIPLTDRGPDTPGIATVIGEGFSGIFTSIGIVIILGALIGLILERTGGGFQMADALVNTVGKRHPILATQLMGFVVSIAVFCDSGFVVLNPIRRALVRRTASASAAMTVALASGLYISHVFIPPTPGPIAAATTLGLEDNLILVIGLGFVVSIPALVVSYFASNWLTRKVTTPEDEEITHEDVEAEYEALRDSYGRLPGKGLSFLPIAVPILAMAIGSIVTMVGWEGFFAELLEFFGIPIIALALGLLVALMLLGIQQRMAELADITEETLKVTGPILFITGAGGVLGAVIAATPVIDYITEIAPGFASIGLFFPFIVSAVLKTAQGSSTVALVTSAGIVVPLLDVLGLQTDLEIALAVMAIAAGAMTVSHANDSYFWVVTRFGNLTVDQGYRTHTVTTGLMGVTSIIFVWLIGLFV
ncbi:MAG TPA: GntP family permease [Yaniella sp.]